MDASEAIADLEGHFLHLLWVCVAAVLASLVALAPRFLIPLITRPAHAQMKQSKSGNERNE